MLLLALDTATPAVTVALHDGDGVVAESTRSTRAGTASCCCPPSTGCSPRRAASSTTSPASSSASAPARTPGCASAWSPPTPSAHALGVPVHGVCTLDGLAYAAGEPARRARSSWPPTPAARRSTGRATTTRAPASPSPPSTAPPTSPTQVAGLPAVGAGAAALPRRLPGRAAAPEHRLGRPRSPRSPPSGWPRARTSLPPRPLYLRRPDAQVPADYKAVTARSDRAPDDRRLREMRWWDIDAGAGAGAATSSPRTPGRAGMFWSELAARPRPGGDPPLRRRRGRPDGRHRRLRRARRRRRHRRRPDHRRRPRPLGHRPRRPAADRPAAGRHRLRVRARCCWRCRVDNARAQRLYERFGFEPIGFRRGYYQPGNVDALVMRLTDPARPPRPAPYKEPRPMADEPLVLGIETSCDETGVGIVRGTHPARRRRRLQRRRARPLRRRRARGRQPRPPGGDGADHRAGAEGGRGHAPRDLDGIAVTAGPGLAGALLVGVSAAKAYAYALGKPLYGVNHLASHICVDQLEHGAAARADDGAAGLRRPLLAAARRPTSPRDVRPLGATIDDAAGEAFDKVARVLGLGFPGGPVIDRHAREGDPDAIAFPRGLTGPRDAAVRLLLLRPEDGRGPLDRGQARRRARRCRCATWPRPSRRRSSTC